ncbi:uncharacterized protein LACBIDRAFT_332619 [Laccaria bicolor S238N-H82]|uniref:Predicted protein n=1 Tax=Laccaria bicolor (strain S238N-H82 / ATCC MYA-4686) TaxID=486041 RepID=B0DTD3_LACBS|nr:uncharacterized protein LACBIDRAFT_332619 [Laccaria bicolor S238N-H82]EDR02256.1 predicted protein [Laccaria bicolor S238N-H82]|eukprot:XP_001887201.1 predicted protein [Laccaria bicolor S238N-H82]
MYGGVTNQFGEAEFKRAGPRGLRKYCPSLGTCIYVDINIYDRNNPEVLRFLDLEAEVSEAETDDENNGNEGDLIDDDEDIDDSISGDAHRNLLREALMPSDDDVFWESFLERITAHRHITEEDIQDIGKPSLWAVLVITLIQSLKLIFIRTFLLSLGMRRG